MPQTSPQPPSKAPTRFGKVTLLCGYLVEAGARYEIAYEWMTALKDQLVNRGMDVDLQVPKSAASLKKYLEAPLTEQPELLVFVGEKVPEDVKRNGTIVVLQPNPRSAAEYEQVATKEFTEWHPPLNRVLIWMTCDAKDVVIAMGRWTTRPPFVGPTEFVPLPQAMYYLTHLLDHFVYGPWALRRSLYQAHHKALTDTYRVMPHGGAALPVICWPPDRPDRSLEPDHVFYRTHPRMLAPLFDLIRSNRVRRVSWNALRILSMLFLVLGVAQMVSCGTLRADLNRAQIQRGNEVDTIPGAEPLQLTPADVIYVSGDGDRKDGWLQWTCLVVDLAVATDTIRSAQTCRLTSRFTRQPLSVGLHQIESLPEFVGTFSTLRIRIRAEPLVPRIRPFFPFASRVSFVTANVVILDR